MFTRPTLRAKWLSWPRFRTKTALGWTISTAANGRADGAMRKRGRSPMRDSSCAPCTYGGWVCQDCGVLNDAEDATCECECADIRREETRRTIIGRLENLSPQERRARLTRTGAYPF